MRFELDAEQSQLQDSLRRLLAAEASHAQRLQIARGDDGWSRELWRKVGELGVTAMTLPSALGGFDMRPVALMAVLPEFGRALSTEPYLAHLLASTAVLHASPAQAEPLLKEDPLAWAHSEPRARHDAHWLETVARSEGEAWFLDGEKSHVMHGQAARHFVVTARTEAGQAGLFVVQAGAPGASVEAGRLIDGTPVGTLRLQRASAYRLDLPHTEGHTAIARTLQMGMAAVCAEAIGVCELALRLTIDHVKLRKQFNRSLAENQAVRHRIAEMQVSLDMVRSAGLAALLALDEDDGLVRESELAKAKMLVSRHATFIAQQAIQLHGGVGMTLEYSVGHCLRRVMVLDQAFGDGKTHAAALGRRMVEARNRVQEGSH